MIESSVDDSRKNRTAALATFVAMAAGAPTWGITNPGRGASHSSSRCTTRPLIQCSKAKRRKRKDEKLARRRNHGR